MHYRRLGRSGVKVSELALGSWLTYGGSVDEKNSVKQMHHAFAQGINFFDTANVYAHGAAENVVGKALSTLKREECFIATKVETLEKVQRLTTLATEAGLTMSQFALAWCLRQSNISSIIIGATKNFQIDENLKAAGVKLSADLIERAEAILGSNVNAVRA